MNKLLSLIAILCAAIVPGCSCRPAGTVCAVASDCPTGYTCTQEQCVRQADGGLRDGSSERHAIDATTGLDAARVDVARVDVPQQDRTPGDAGSADRDLTDAGPADTGASDRAASDGTLTERPTSDLASAPDADCSVTTFSFPAVADSLINAYGNNFGQKYIMNIGVGRALIRFAITDQDLASKLLANDAQVRGFSLRLTRALYDSECGDASLCPGSPGAILVTPLRTDWTEGTGDGNTGVTWNFLHGSANVSAQWNSAGAGTVGIDRGQVACIVTISGNESEIILPLQRNAFFENRDGGASWFTPNYALLEVAVIVEMNTGAFTIASRDNPMYREPTFTLELCQ